MSLVDRALANLPRSGHTENVACRRAGNDAQRQAGLAGHVGEIVGRTVIEELKQQLGLRLLVDRLGRVTVPRSFPRPAFS